MKKDNHKDNHLFGPVPSRRLGMSLGVDMVPFKTCTLNCVYCECGKTTELTAERKEYIPAQALINELDARLSTAPHLDVITFAGSGEPTLSTALSAVVNHVRTTYPQYKTAILTNSTLLHIREVRNTLMHIDYVLPSLDAVSQQTFEKINRPVATVSSTTVITGLIAFAKEYTGTLWVELFIVPGINDTNEELSLIKSVLEEIHPTRVQINTLDRPAPCEWVQPASQKQLSHIARFLLPLPVEIISRNATADPSIVNNTATLENLYAILKRRPMTIEDVAVAMQKNINEIFSLLDELKKNYSLIAEKVGDKTFYRL